MLGVRALSGVMVATFSLAALSASAATYDSQWALENKGQRVCRFDGRNCLDGKVGADIKAKQVRASVRDCTNAVVAVLDTGADLNHPDLKANLIPGKNFVDSVGSDSPQDDNLHGTHVSGIIAGAGTEAKGVMGVCNRAKVLPVKVGSAEGYLTDSDVIEGIEFAVANKAKVVNASFGGGPSNELVKKAIANATNTIFVIASGNGDWFGRGYDIDSDPVYPASYDLPNIVAVAATDSQDKLGKFSNFGANSVHIAAPGVNIVSTMPMVATKDMKDNKIPTEAGAIDGTSMATPYVAGAAALLWSSNPSMTVAEVKEKLVNAVDKLDTLQGKVKSGGRLNLAKLFQ